MTNINTHIKEYFENKTVAYLPNYGVSLKFPQNSSEVPTILKSKLSNIASFTSKF